ncbi:MAG: DPP IV N-terminal domain-containing protein [bacterium]
MKKKLTSILSIILSLTLLTISLFSAEKKQTEKPDLNSGKIFRIKWSDDGNYLYYSNCGKDYKLDLNTLEISYAEKENHNRKESIKERIKRIREKNDNKDPRIKQPERGRQYLTEKSPDETWYAICENWNVVLENILTGEKINVTRKGNRKFRYGTANWVYGEELNVKHGMWWTPDSKKLIYYVFDERPVEDFYLIGDLTEINTKLLVEGYTKAGAPNPIASLEIYDIESKTRTPIDCGEGEYYIYNMRFSPDGTYFLYNHTDRHQRHLKVVALNYKTLEKKVIVSENQETWQENSPYMEFLENREQFIWETEKTMWNHYQLRNLNGTMECVLTSGDFPDEKIIKIDEENNWIYYKAYSDQNHPLCAHIHRVHLNGNGQQRLTDKPYNHTQANLSPDGKWLTVQYENVSVPPSTALYKTDGTLVKILAQGPAINDPRSELFSYIAGDSTTTLYGILHKPENFDPSEKYPLIVGVYGGPGSKAIHNFFQNGHYYNKEGYLVAHFDNRGTSGRGKNFKNAVYGKLGEIDIQDQALGVKFIRKRQYIDPERVGIVGHSYGGYMAAMAIVKYPDVFTAAVDRAGVTDWRNYDSIYTERFMNLPQDNPEGYDKATVMKYVENIKGHLLIMHGLIDDNVHPTNAWQLIDALNKANISYESRFFPHGTHGFGGRDTQMDFFKRYLQY